MMLFGLAGGAVNAQDSSRMNSAAATNIITDRLTAKDLRRWEAIKRIVFAEDLEGQPLHPTLRGLWDKLERSGHVIYIEMRGMGRAISNTAGAEGFIPFQGLSKEERYAEVLGHELAHAVHILSDPARARMVKEVVQETNELFLSYGRQYGYANVGPEMQRRLSLRDALLKELEEPA